MSARAAVIAEEDQKSAAQWPGDMYFLTVPAETYRAISDAAAKKGMTIAQAMQAAFRGFLSETQPAAPSGPQLLTELKK